MNDLQQSYEHIVMTVALMGPRFEYSGYELRPGFIWVSFDTPTTLLFIENNGGYRRVYYDQNQLNMYGLRISIIPNNTISLGDFIQNKFVTSSSNNLLNDIHLFVKFDLDLFGGIYKPDKDAIKAINPEHEKLIDDFLMPAIRTRGLIGLDYLFPLSNINKRIKFGLGVDITYCSFIHEFLQRQGESYWWSSPNFSGTGIYARIELKL
jgi:hypothetical protein